jgi:E3 ubiquitin-protein ligase SIAH1
MTCIFIIEFMIQYSLRDSARSLFAVLYLIGWLVLFFFFGQVFHCFGQYFCLHFEAFQLGMAPVYMAFLRFMGDETEARNYTYSLEVGGHGRKLTWEGTPQSVRDSHRKVRDSHDGLIIQRNMALFFSGGDRKELKLRVTGRIWKEQQNPETGVCIPNLCS